MIAQAWASDDAQLGRVVIPLARQLSNRPVFCVKQHSMKMAAWVGADTGAKK
ncbi:hypothetical protein [Burkholderia lata]|uniref:hypothetical protein n=1 Tax=Burkholderia lata (strain ATCC 17760 / DSM 23089 / LMG 22485 / NCIMB 9086 / R18194 / 383) TaxID=482957 RepID=UPI0015823FA8|nr:hypothetical protein [Burkholderia lata]